MEIEKYSEDLDKYLSLVHSACEGRYNLSGYDLHVIEAALHELHEFKNSNVGIVNERIEEFCTCGWPDTDTAGYMCYRCLKPIKSFTKF